MCCPAAESRHPARDNPRIASSSTPQGSHSAGSHRWARRVAGWIVRERNPAGVVYGTILIGALIAAESGVHDGYPDLIGSTALTLGIYWLAHSYSTALGGRLSHEEHLTVGALARALGHDWSIVRGASIPLLTLLIAWAVGASETTGINAAVWAAVASLIVFELLAGLRAGSRPREFALEGGVGVVMGLAIFALKSLAH
ncbi:MAG TPA: hypothetical protein VG053_04160 [Solirubrobacteraceae bacterium]|nr:hypothetical protein [Solirubrobacteraceae bacterium]